ncbi:MAG: efflux RND transporter permease subunit [Clostridium sp.]|nr:efflux RND transporter permease subunit [Bacteroides sp.]MCM1197762.1 efflux RND transporter permease subunit [Clostridium sp.]
MMQRQGKFIRASIAQKKIVYFILFLLIAIGIYGLTTINKDEFPTFEIKEGLVVGVYPGATATEVEEQLTKPLEELLFTFSEVSRSTYSYSRDGICYIYVMLDSPASKKDEVWSKIKHQLNSFKPMLPPGVLAVAVMDDFSSISSLLIAMESQDKSYSEMKEYSDGLCERLREIPALANARIYGTQEEEIAVHVDMDRLSAYGITPSMLMLDYQTSSLQTMGGTFRTSCTESPIHVTATAGSEKEIAEKIVYAGPQGDILRLCDIATIERRYKEPSSIVGYNGHTALIVSVEMRPDNNIVAFGREVDKVLNEFGKDLPESVKVTKITDQPKVVRTSVWSFLRDLVISMLVVIVVMLLLFPARSAMIASTGVPACTAVAIAVMYLTGMSLNTVTLAALIVVLGMIVDDSIITMDGYMDKLGRGMERVDAACASAKELFMPMMLATAAISLMFFPMLGIISGYLGDFVQSFPWVISIALAASLIYAVTVVPSLEVKYIRSAKTDGNGWFARGQEKFFNGLQNGYEKLQGICFRHPYLTILAGITAIALGILMFLQLNIQMMPMAVRDCFAVEIYLDANAGLDKTREITDSLEHILLSDKRVTSVTSFVGTGSPRFHSTYAPKVPAPNFAQLIVNTGTAKETEDILREYETVYESYFPEAQIRFKQMDYQGNATAQVAVTFKGASMDEMRPYADSLKGFMSGMDDMLKWVHSDCNEHVSTINVNLDPEEAARLGVNRTLLSLSLAGAFNGLAIASVWEDGTKIPVTLYSKSVSSDMPYETVGNQMIPTSLPGVDVPLRQVASVTPGWEPKEIPHTGGRQSIGVYADMVMGQSQPEAMAMIDKYINDKIAPVLPAGIQISYGGLTGTNNTVIPEIMLSFFCAVAVLFFFLLFHFKKISLAVLTMVLSLLCLFGAFFGLWIFGLDFGMTSVLGLISLVGIIVRNGIIMFEYAEELRFAGGLSVKEAAEEAGRRRMRPIFLTSCTTALGVLPMILSGDSLWMPMGIVICFGTMMSIILIVLVMPVSYWQLFRRSDTAGGPSSGSELKESSSSVKAIVTATVAVTVFFLAGTAVSAQEKSIALNLEDCRNMAMQNNASINNARLDIYAAQAQKGEALAEYFPKVSINAFAYYAFDPLLEIGVKDILGNSDMAHNITSWVNQYAPMYGIDPYFSALKKGYSAVISAVQPVFAGGRIVYGNRLASLGVEAAELQGRIQTRKSNGEIEQMYWQVVSLQEKMKTLDQVCEMLDTLQKDLSSAISAGLATQTDMLQVKLRQNELRSAKTRLHGGIRLAKMNLCNSIGLRYTPYSTINPESLPHIDSISVSGDLEIPEEPMAYWRDENEIAAGREETRLLDIAVDAKAAERRMVLGEVLPQVGVGASYGYGSIIGDGSFNGAVFATLKIPITDWGKYSRRLQRYGYQVEKARNDREYLGNQLLLQVRQLWLEVTVSWEQMLLAEESEYVAQSVVKDQMSQYKAGLIPLSELMSAQTSLRQSADAHIDAQIAYRTALQRYIELFR